VREWGGRAWCVRQGACRFWRGEMQKVGSSRAGAQSRETQRERFFTHNSSSKMEEWK
jgi:hypothetical protein